MKKTTQMTRHQLEELRDELVAINFWDERYENSKSHDFIETTAWEARRRRLREIVKLLTRDGGTLP